MPYQTLSDGVPLYYIDAGAGRPLVLMNALMFNADYFWKKNTGELKKSCRVIAVDLRGQGLSGKPNHGYTISRFAQDLEELFEALDLDDIVLAGLSVGGFVALEYLRQFGDGRIGHLVLMEMTPRLPSAPDWDHPTFGDFPLEAAQGYGAAFRENRSIYNDFFNAAFLTPPSGAELDEMLAQTYLTPTDVAADVIDQMAEIDERDHLATVTLPTTLFYGYPNNRILPTAVGQWIEQQMPNARLVTFANSSHCCFWEEPDRFNRELAAVVGAS